MHVLHKFPWPLNTQITGQTSNPEHLVAWLLDHSNLDVPDIDSVPAAPSSSTPAPVVPVPVEDEGDDADDEGDGEGEDDEDESSSEDSDGYELNVDTAAVTGAHY